MSSTSMPSCVYESIAVPCARQPHARCEISLGRRHDDLASISPWPRVKRSEKAGLPAPLGSAAARYSASLERCAVVGARLLAVHVPLDDTLVGGGAAHVPLLGLVGRRRVRGEQVGLKHLQWGSWALW